MQLKCVGGRCDGMIINVDLPRERQGDAIRVYSYPIRVAELDIKPPSSDDIAIDQFIYVIDVLKYQHSKRKNDYSEIWFLRPSNLTSFDAIQYQFRK